MELGHLAATLGLAPEVAEFMQANGYDAAEAAFDPALPRLQDAFLLEQYAKIGDRHGLENALVQAAARARFLPGALADSLLLRLFKQIYLGRRSQI